MCCVERPRRHGRNASGRVKFLGKHVAIAARVGLRLRQACFAERDRIAANGRRRPSRHQCPGRRRSRGGVAVRRAARPRRGDDRGGGTSGARRIRHAGGVGAVRRQNPRRAQRGRPRGAKPRRPAIAPSRRGARPGGSPAHGIAAILRGSPALAGGGHVRRIRFAARSPFSRRRCDVKSGRGRTLGPDGRRAGRAAATRRDHVGPPLSLGSRRERAFRSGRSRARGSRRRSRAEARRIARRAPRPPRPRPDRRSRRGDRGASHFFRAAARLARSRSGNRAKSC